MKHTKPTAITELILADAQLAVLGGCLPTEALTELAADLDVAGYAALQVMTPTLYQHCLEALQESPWHRIASLKQAASHTPLLVTLSVTQLFGTEPVDVSVLEACVDELAEAGIGVLRWTDATDDPALSKQAVAFTQAQGMQAQLCLWWNAQATDAIADICRQAAAVGDASADALVICDDTGSLSPTRLSQLTEQLITLTHLPLQVHLSEATGMASASILAGLEAGLVGMDTALSAFSMGYSFPPTESLVAILEGSPRDSGQHLTGLEPIAGKARRLRLRYAFEDTASPGLDVRMLKHRLPPYALRELEKSLKHEQASELFEAALAQIESVRLAAGEPVMTPAISKILVKQAVLNTLCNSPFQSLTGDYQQLLKNNLQHSEKINPALSARIAEMVIVNNKPLKLMEDCTTPLTAWASPKLEAKATDSKSTVLDYLFYPQATLEMLRKQGLTEAAKAKPEAAAVGSEGAANAEVYTVNIDGKAYVVSVDSSGQVNGIVPPAQA